MMLISAYAALYTFGYDFTKGILTAYATVLHLYEVLTCSFQVANTTTGQFRLYE